MKRAQRFLFQTQSRFRAVSRQGSLALTAKLDRKSGARVAPGLDVAWELNGGSATAQRREQYSLFTGRSSARWPWEHDGQLIRCRCRKSTYCSWTNGHGVPLVKLECGPRQENHGPFFRIHNLLLTRLGPRKRRKIACVWEMKGSWNSPSAFEEELDGVSGGGELKGELKGELNLAMNMRKLVRSTRLTIVMFVRTYKPPAHAYIHAIITHESVAFTRA